MRVKLFTFRYSATLGGIDDSPVTEFTRDEELLTFREHPLTAVNCSSLPGGSSAN